MTKENSAALLIGVDEYDNFNDFQPLPTVINDLKSVKEIFGDVRLGNFRDLKPLSNPDIQTAKREIEYFFNKYKEGVRRFFFYFSGHGFLADEMFYLACKTTDKQAPDTTAISASFVHRVIKKNILRSGHVIIVLDTCCSEAFEPPTNKGNTLLQGDEYENALEIATQEAMSRNLKGRGRVTFTSSSRNEYSVMKVSGQKLSDDSESLYTKYFLGGIKTGLADEDKDGFITAAELHRYAKRQVEKATPRMTPQYFSYREGDSIEISRSPSNSPDVEFKEYVEKKLNIPYREAQPQIKYHQRRLGIKPDKAQDIIDQLIGPKVTFDNSVDMYKEEVVEAVAEERGDFTSAKQIRRNRGLRSIDVRDINWKYTHNEALPSMSTESQVNSMTSDVNGVASNTEDSVVPDDDRYSDLGNSSLKEDLEMGRLFRADRNTAKRIRKHLMPNENVWLSYDDKDFSDNPELSEIDRLWMQHSDDRFGLKIQRKIWNGVNRDPVGFGRRVGWISEEGLWLTYSEIQFDKGAPEGHLPAGRLWDFCKKHQI